VLHAREGSTTSFNSPNNDKESTAAATAGALEADIRRRALARFAKECQCHAAHGHARSISGVHLGVPSGGWARSTVL